MKIHLLIILLLHQSIVFCQAKINCVEIDRKYLDMIPNRYLFDYEGNHYFQFLQLKNKIQLGHLKTQSMGVVAYDKNLKEVKYFELHVQDKNEYFIESFVSAPLINLISYHIENDQRIITANSYNQNGKLTLSQKLLTTTYNGDVLFLYSQDSSKFAVLVLLDKERKNENCSIDACVLDITGKILWTKHIDLGSASYDFDFKTTYLDNNANLYTLLRQDLPKDKYNFQLKKINQEKTSSVTINAQEKIGLTKLYESKEGLFLAGFNMNVKDDIYNSPFIVKITQEAKSIQVPVNTIDDSFLEPLIEAKRYKKKKGWSPYMNLLHAWTNEEGDHRNIYELSYISKETSGSITWTYYENKDYFMFNFDKNGKFKDLKICPKEVKLDADHLISPERSYIKDDAMYSVYNECSHNLNLASLDDFKMKGNELPILRKFTPDGKIKDTKLNLLDKEDLAIPNSVGLTNNNELIYYLIQIKLLRANNFKICKCSLNSNK